MDQNLETSYHSYDRVRSNKMFFVFLKNRVSSPRTVSFASSRNSPNYLVSDCSPQFRSDSSRYSYKHLEFLFSIASLIVDSCLTHFILSARKRKRFSLNQTSSLIPANVKIALRSYEISWECERKKRNERKRRTTTGKIIERRRRRRCNV